MRIPPEFVPQTQETPADFGIVEPTSAVYPFPVTTLTSTVDLLSVPSEEYWRVDQFSLYNFNSSVADICSFLIRLHI